MGQSRRRCLARCRGRALACDADAGIRQKRSCGAAVRSWRGNYTMLRQTLSALWPWISGKLPSWKRPVIELSVNTTLDGTAHNNAILVCSSPILISALVINTGSGFSCEVINASLGPVTFSGNIVTSNGSNGLMPSQCGSIQCVTYSVGTTVFASISVGGSATVVPGQASGLAVSSITSSNRLLKNP